jgi:opacity protein-like surface antigen
LGALVNHKAVLSGLFGSLLVVSVGFVPQAKAQAPQVANWTGFYAGVHAGNAAVTNEWKNGSGGLSGADPFDGAFTSGGLIRGFQFGYNYQVGRIVYGLEADASFGDIEGGARCAFGVYVCDAKIDALGTITPRLGYAFGNMLLFGKAGAAWAHERVHMDPTPGYGQTDGVNGNAWRWGWTVGAGVEYAFTPSLSAKAEYNFLEFANGEFNLTDPTGAPGSAQVTQQVHLIKVGLNYRLGEKSPLERPFGGRGELPAWSWTGIYAGLHAGGGWGMTDWKSADGALQAASTFGFPGSGQANGSIAGGQLGFNYQFGTWVVGGELSASWSNLDGFARCATTTAGPASFVCHTRIDALAMATGRIGHTFGNLMVYSLGGFAVAREKHDAYQAFGTTLFTGNATRTGYVLGSGLEYALTPAWSAKIEYNYIDLGNKTVAMTDGAGNVSNVLIGQQLQLVKMGMNYKFGADPFAPGMSFAALSGKQSVMSSGWVMEAGLRYAFSNGKSQQDLYSNTDPGQVNSRLIYGEMGGHAAETFFRFDHDSRVFVKGNFGLGSLVNGTLHDEDMPPDTSPYSNTIHSMKDGALRYGSLDIGFNLLSGDAGKLGPYVGYRYFHQLGRGYGCEQVAAAGNICTPGPASYQLALTETESWRGAAIGVNAQLALSPRWTLEVDAAYLPYVDRAGVDNHWARANINPGPETGNGWGTQVEAILSYAVNDRLSLGLGGRYWFFTTTSASAIFPNSAVPAPLIFTSERYGGFVQASYKIGDVKRLDRAETEPSAVVDWTGFYVGGHLGAGRGRADWTDPFPAPVTGDRVPLGGALGGAQVGFNKQFGKVVLGAQFSASAARIEGSETCFGGIVPATNAGLNCDNRIGPMAAVTGRAGYAFDRSLVYATAGVALANERYTLNSKAIAGGTISTAEATNWGWTVGAGIEHALNARWSVVAEYKYVDFGSRDVAFAVPAAIAAAATTPVTSRVHLMTLGANYHFDAMTK